MDARLQMHNKIVMLSRKFRQQMKNVREELAKLSLLQDVPQVQIDALDAIEEQYNECYDDFEDAKGAMNKARRRRSQKGLVKEMAAELEEIRQKLQRLQRSRENARACLVRLASTDYPELVHQDDVELGALTGEEAGVLTIGRMLKQ